MAVINWGLLAKSAVDGEKIEEAIDRLIAAHNDDETAHLEEGQSLLSHKAAEIIDHLAGSIVEDKFANGVVSSRAITSDQIYGKDIRTAHDVGVGVDGVAMKPTGIEMWQGGVKKVNIPVSGDASFAGEVAVKSLSYLRDTIATNFESIDGWSGTKDYTTPQLGCFTLETDSGTVNWSYLDILHDNFWGVYNDRNPMFSITLSTGYDDNQNIYFGIGQFINGQEGISVPGQESGFGFKIVGDNLYAFYCNATSGFHTHLISGVNILEKHRYMAVMTSGVKIDYYVDGVLEYTFDYEALGWPDVDDTFAFTFGIKGSEASIKTLKAGNLLIQQDY